MFAEHVECSCHRKIMENSKAVEVREELMDEHQEMVLL